MKQKQSSRFSNRGLTPGKTRAPVGGQSATAALKTVGGYRINRDGSISFAPEILAEKASNKG